MRLLETVLILPKQSTFQADKLLTRRLKRMSMDIRVLSCPSEELDSCLPRLFDLINDAYASQDRSFYGTEDLFGSQRLRTPHQLVQELGKHGLVAVIFNESDQRENTGMTDAKDILAVACLKPWKGKTIDVWKVQKEKGMLAGIKDVVADDSDAVPRDWEVATCASRNDARYRKQGLISRCLAALIEHLKARRDADRTQPLSLWVTALEGVGNVEYWQRRGFERQGEPDVASADLWGASRSFKIGTLKRTDTMIDH